MLLIVSPAISSNIEFPVGVFEFIFLIIELSILFILFALIDKLFLAIITELFEFVKSVCVFIDILLPAISDVVVLNSLLSCICCNNSLCCFDKKTCATKTSSII